MKKEFVLFLSSILLVCLFTSCNTNDVDVALSKRVNMSNNGQWYYDVALRMTPDNNFETLGGIIHLGKVKNVSSITSKTVQKYSAANFSSKEAVLSGHGYLISSHYGQQFLGERYHWTNGNAYIAVYVESMRYDTNEGIIGCSISYYYIEQPDGVNIGVSGGGAVETRKIYRSIP